MDIEDSIDGCEDSNSSPVDPDPPLLNNDNESTASTPRDEEIANGTLSLDDLQPEKPLTSEPAVESESESIPILDQSETESDLLTDQPSLVAANQPFNSDSKTQSIGEELSTNFQINLENPSPESQQVDPRHSDNQNISESADESAQQGNSDSESIPCVSHIGSTNQSQPSEPDEMELPKPSAECRYRWSKVIETNSSDIGFYPSYAPDQPVLLSWDSQERAYFSPETRIVCGDYHGTVVVNGNVLPVEDFSVRSYTFEIDLYIKEDLLEDEVADSHPNLQDTKSSPSDSTGIHDVDKGEKTNSRIEDLVRHQMNENEELRNGINMGDVALSSSLKSDNGISFTNLKRDSPVGDDDIGKYSESKADTLKDMEVALDRYRNSLERTSSMEGSEKAVSRTSVHNGSAQDFVEDVVVTPTRPLSRASIGTNESVRGSLGAGSTHNSLKGSTRESPVQDSIYGRPLSKASDRFAPASSLRQDDLSSPPRASSARPPSVNDPPSAEQIAPSPTYSNHSLSRASPSRQMASPVAGVSQSPTRITPQRDLESFHGSRERIMENGDQGRPRSLPGSRPPSCPISRQGSQHSSRPQSIASLTSEQELGQYLEDSRSSSVDRHLPSGITPHPDESLMDPAIMRGAERSSSVPNYITQPQMSPDKRSVTPDNRIRVPPPASSEIPSFQSTVVTERMRETVGRSSVTSNVSRSSSRTVTPVAVENGVKEINPDRIHNLEDSVSNLRKLLASRESEVFALTTQMNDLKDINRSLKDELDHRGKRHTPVSSVPDSLEFKQLQSEKEILASEVVTLREELQKMANRYGGSGRSSTSSGISDYSPHSPVVLQRKIVDLEAHIRDLQEVNESTTSGLSRAEEKLKLLHEENRELKSRALSTSDLHTDVDQHTLRVELRTLREDIRNLKERNYQLTEENMRLMESQGLKAKEAGNQDGPRLSSSLRSDDGSVRQTTSYSTSAAYRRDFAPTSHRPSSALERPASSQSITAPRKHSREDFAPREFRNPSLNRSYDLDRSPVDNGSNRLLQQRNSIESSRIRYPPKESIHGQKPAESSRGGVLYADRSRPDGEVSEKLHSDRYAKSQLTYERRSYEDAVATDRGSSSYLDKHSYKSVRQSDQAELRPRGDYSTRPREDVYKYSNENARESDMRVTSPRRIHANGAALSSKDIFFSLQQKRAGQWLRQDNKYISGNLDFQRYQNSPGRLDDPGDDSDTATDILLAQDTHPRAHQRRTSLGSDGSPSSLSDVEDSADNILRRRSKSVDTNRGQDSSRSRQLSTLQRSGSATRPLSSTDNMRGSAGHRSVLPAPLVTQHNKGELASKNTAAMFSSSLTQGLRPFAPRSPADIRPEDVVKFSRLGGKLTQGVVKYVGHLPGRSEAYLGVELDKDEGKHDGTFEGIRYFKCKPSKGVFVAFNKVVMAWAP